MDQTPADRTRNWLRETMDATGMTASEWAAKAGVSRATIFRALKPGYQFTTSRRTLQMLAAAAGVDHPDIEAHAAPPGSCDLPIRYEVAAGAWRAVDEQVDVPYGHIRVERVSPYEHFAQWAERVVGDSYNKVVPEGSLVHVVDAVDMQYQPRHGDTVVVVRRRAQGAFEERSLKQIEIGRDGEVSLWPRSHNPRWSEPLELMAGLREGEDVEILIAGKVIRSYQVFD